MAACRATRTEACNASDAGRMERNFSSVVTIVEVAFSLTAGHLRQRVSRSASRRALTRQ